MLSREHCLSKISDLVIETFYSASPKAKANKKSLPAALSLPAFSQPVHNKTNHQSSFFLVLLKIQFLVNKFLNKFLNFTALVRQDHLRYITRKKGRGMKLF